MREQALASIRQRDAAAIAVKQYLLQLDLKVTNLMAERRLRNRQEGRSLGEAAEFRDVDEVVELLNIHVSERTVSG